MSERFPGLDFLNRVLVRYDGMRDELSFRPHMIYIPVRMPLTSLRRSYSYEPIPIVVVRSRKSDNWHVVTPRIP